MQRLGQKCRTKGKDDTMADMGFGYSPNCDWDIFTDNELAILDNLPHGSGIDYDWMAEKLGNGKIKAHNAYHAMDENGFYCRVFDFSVTFRPSDPGDFRLMFHGCNPEKVSCGLGLRDYLEETIHYCITRTS